MTYANRGKGLETLIDYTNSVYLRKRIACIHKIPTPIKVIRKNGKIAKAWFDAKSTVDYIGVSKGKHIAFDAKSTEQKSLPLKMIQEHQIEHLSYTAEQNGLSFFIVEFSTFQEYYFIPFSLVLEYIKEAKRGGRKSIPYRAFQEKGKQIKAANGVPIDYLSVLDFS